MSFSLGQAKLILDVDAQPLIEGEAVAWKTTRQGAQAVSAFLARENNVRITDVKKAASIIITENKKVASETLKAEKIAAAERKKLIIDGIKNEVALLKESERYRKERARSILSEEKRIEAERVAAVRKSFAEEAAIRRKREQDEKGEAGRRSVINAQGSQGSNSGVLGSGISSAGVGATTATLLGFGAIASTAVIARAAILGVVDATLKQDEAQRALNGSFGKTAIIYKDLAAQYSKQFSLVSSTTEKAIGSLGTLSRQSNLTSTQIKSLAAVAIDLQAAYGGDLQEAFRSTGAAVLGETEALEKYNIVLQDNVLKTLPQLTEEEKKRFTVMSESEKQLIRYRVLMDLAKDATGSATQRAKDAQGGFNELTNSFNKLSLALGKEVVPATGRAASGFASIVEWITKVIEKNREYMESIREINFQRGPDSSGPLGLVPAQDIIDEGSRRRIAGYEKEAVAIRQAQEKESKDNIQKEENARVDAINAANKRRAEIAKTTLEEAAAREIKILTDRIDFEERIRDNQLEANEERKRIELDRLEQVEYARKQASSAELERIQKEKTAALRAADEKRDVALREIQVEREAANDSGQENIRQLEIAKDRRTEANDATRDNAVKAAEEERAAVLEIRKQEDRDIEDSLTRQDRAREAAHTKNVRRFEREGEALRESYDKAIIKLEDKEKNDDDNHNKRNKQIEDESRKQLDAIDKQIRALDDAEKAEDARRRRRELSQRRSSAQTTLFRALGSQDPTQIAGARDKLTQALRIGNPEAVRKAQEELLDISGKGRDAIAEAQQDLANIEEDLISENVKQANDAQKQKLQDEKDAISKSLENEKRQEDERNTRRKTRLDRDKQAEKERLDNALKSLEKRQEAETDAFKKEKQDADDLEESQKRQLEDKRSREDDAYKNKLDQIKDQYEKEQKAIKATYDDEETGLIPAIRRALDFANKQYEERARNVRVVYEEEQENIQDTYDELIRRHREAEESAQRSHTLALAAANAHYDAEQKKIKETYENDSGTGIIDRLKSLKKHTEENLALDLKEWEKWERGLNGPDGVLTKTWKQAQEDFKKFLEDIKAQGGITLTPRIVVNPPRFTGSQGSGSDRDNDSGDGGPVRGRGIGTTQSPQTTTATTGSPDPEQQQGSGIPSDEISNMFTESFGYGKPYSGQYTPGPGWSGRAAWPGGPSHHKGVDLILPGERNGYGKPVPAFHDGVVKRTVSDSNGPGGNMVIIEDGAGRTHWYLHLKNYAVTAGRPVRRGEIIGQLGDTGTEEFPHLHYEVRNGDNNGPMSLEALQKNGINPNSFIRGRDAGNTFRNPTMYMDMVTRERGIMAEKGPETLLGSKDTQNLRNMLAFAPRMNTSPMSVNSQSSDYSIMGMNLTGLNSGNNPTIVEGDKMIYNGVAPENLMKEWRDDQRRQKVLRGGS